MANTRYNHLRVANAVK